MLTRFKVLSQAIQSSVIYWLVVIVTVKQGLCQPVKLRTCYVHYHHLQ